MPRLLSNLMPACALAVALLAAAPVARAQGGSRGELLYSTHCIACHTEQMHWRAKKQASDWAGLKVQVRRWQGNAGLNWSDDDIVEVARYLNARFYRFAPTGAPLSSAPAVPAPASMRADRAGAGTRWCARSPGCAMSG